MTASRRVVRLKEDAAGESHFDDYEITLEVSDFAPPAPSLLVSSVGDASGYVVVRLPVGWVGERHPSPHRQILFCLSGELKVTASDGEIRMVKTGSAWLMADTRGKGHETEVVSDEPCDAAIILLND
ncbi:MAG: cupin domain-containing protein [Phyllobacterium sp.]|uniref:cupin domain-containing protein n=1 Tax=Phyllobacterium sp. TaxID=1871046 RepID=UPI0030F27315